MLDGKRRSLRRKSYKANCGNANANNHVVLLLCKLICDGKESPAGSVITPSVKKEDDVEAETSQVTPDSLMTGPLSRSQSG